MPDILSVGIDIGTSTTQVIFSQLTMDNTSGYFSVPRVSIVSKKVIYKSPIYITPFLTATLIDGGSIGKIVNSEYIRAGYTTDDIDTGAVIITGESARKENAALVLEELSGLAGDFVVSTAGPDLEAIIAGKGSGAFQYSMDHECVVANLDIGGGTTNVAVFDCGEVIAKGCIDVGGRLIRVSHDLTVEQISPAAAAVAASAGVEIAKGKKTTIAALTSITNAMASLLEQLMSLTEATPLLKAVKTPGSSEFTVPKSINRICFSGGVADHIYSTGRDPLAYGDIGVLLGKSIHESRLFQEMLVMEAKETIRATVVGAGTYTTSITGSTITYTEDLFPLKNIPVLQLTQKDQEIIFRGEDGILEEKLRWFLTQSSSDKVALAFTGKPDPSYVEIKNAGYCLAQALDRSLAPQVPVIIVVECDIAKALGNAVNSCLKGKRSVICIDSIKAEQNDYLDLGKPLMDGLVIPVVVKTLIFG
jgi:ethanolamine utilization protein EutA